MISLSDILSNPDEIYSIKQVSQALRLSKPGLAKWVRDGKIKGKFISNTWIITGQAVIDYLNSQKDGDGFKSLKEILKDYKLPFER
jgi:hypothetical protein